MGVIMGKLKVLGRIIFRLFYLTPHKRIGVR